ncbi:MAG: DUF2914 domain-containing protein [Myxococcales bacterium]|nr:DUF2914 domain-containing protein [Myxococcales bacterium]
MLALLLVALFAPPAGGPLTVTAIGAGTAVESRTLVGVASTFPANGDPVFAHATLDNPGPGEATITWVWLHDGKEAWRDAHTIGKSPAWRSWTRKRMAKDAIGSWTVEIRGADGAVLHAVVFDVVAPPG